MLFGCFISSRNQVTASALSANASAPPRASVTISQNTLFSFVQSLRVGRSEGCDDTEGSIEGILETEGSIEGILETEGSMEGILETEGAMEGMLETEGSEDGMLETCLV